MIVKPANPGAVIRDPRTKRQLPAAGGRVPDSSYWRRRLRSGDVVPVTDEQPLEALAPDPVESTP